MVFPSLALDMPILFFFEKQQLLLWLVEFQEDKTKFSIYKLLRYTTDLMEAHPQVLVIPTVLFTDRTKWRKDVVRKLQTKLNDRLFLHFEYMFFKLFDSYKPPPQVAMAFAFISAKIHLFKPVA